MNVKNWLTTGGSAFLGGVGMFASTHMSSGPPSTLQQWEAFGIGALVVGLVAVVHLFETSPADKPAIAAMATRVALLTEVVKADNEVVK